MVERDEPLKIALVCPSFPPRNCGVGDYTARLAVALSSAGHSVAVWTGEPEPLKYESVSVHVVPKPWRHRALRQIGASLRNWKPDAVVIQYSPYLYARFGIHPLLPPWIAALRAALRRPIAVVAHEHHYPLGLQPDRLALGVPQFAVFQAITLAADRVFFAYEVLCERYRARFPWRRERFSWLPVGANVGLAPGGTVPEGTAEERRVLLQFGGAHPTRLFDLSFAALDAARAELGSSRVALVFAGLDQATVTKELERCGVDDLRDSVRALGYLSAEQVSAWLRRADVVLAPYLDGVSTRRGSVASALEHGKPVVTTRGWATDPSFGWEKVCALSDPDPRAFAHEAVGLLKDVSRASALGTAARQKFQEKFAWPTIAREMVSQLAGNG